jgi:pyridoxal phosphate-dependent aminotransferase EpsN
MHFQEQRILLSVPHMSGEELRYVQAAFDSNWLSSVGPNIVSFERALEERIGVPAVALSSGTAAIHLGLRLLGVQPGDEVFCPTLTFAATCNPVRYLGAEPVLLDSECKSWCLDPNILETSLRVRADQGRLPRAVAVVHLYGQCADMDPILEACRRYEVPVLEDAAQALGATYKGHPAGTLGDVGAFSFNGNKIITTTGGGALISRNPAWAAKARFWAQQARDPGLAYEHSELGYNYRMSNVLAGIGCGQLGVLDVRIEQRRAIAFRYRDAFADIPGISLMPQAAYGLHTNWLSSFLIDEKELGRSRNELITELDRAQIESRPTWKPMHLQRLYQGCEYYGGAVAEDLFRRGICLPSSSSLSAADQLRVINAVRAVAGVAPLEAGLMEGSGTKAPEFLAVEPTRGAASNGLIDTRDTSIEISRASVESLLGRSAVRLDKSAIRGSLEGETVLITGATGSIGSELCRQIAQFNPAGIVGFDMAESALFEVDVEMRKAFPEVPFYAEIGNIQNRARLDEVLRRYHPNTIYHAAAYKHVPLMETHVFEAIENNVFGTCSLAITAAAHRIERFVLISSDKAVRPTSVMGATKRMAEMVLTGLRSSGTRAIIVRFGNVLESNGSVIPIFRKQIAAGGPVTVTHPEMHRFFMTNSEACQLVLLAAAMGESGHIYVLNMGPPVRILDLARKLIRMAGRDEEDIRIEITGTRAGEKLSEEIGNLLDDTMPTQCENIRVLRDCETDGLELERQIETLRVLCASRDLQGAVQILTETVEGYKPSRELLERMCEGAVSVDVE